ncbi:MAG TPA: lipoprotein [Burkholderiales bacterium]
MPVSHATARRLVVIVLLIAAPLGACGKKGPLYLPDAAQAAARPAADA